MRKTGNVLMILGAALLAAALALFAFNRTEDTSAQEAVVEVMPQLVQNIREQTAREETLPDASQLQIPVELLTEEDVKMEELEVDGNGYVGYLRLPALGLELPVLGDWSYRKLNIAPCRYTGSVRGENLVIMAHNYRSHFGKLSRLSLGDSVSFTDINGNTTAYEVVGKDILEPTAVEEMTSGDFDLTLFTCTYGGRSRVTVYCDGIKE